MSELFVPMKKQPKSVTPTQTRRVKFACSPENQVIIAEAVEATGASRDAIINGAMRLHQGLAQKASPVAMKWPPIFKAADGSLYAELLVPIDLPALGNIACIAAANDETMEDVAGIILSNGSTEAFNEDEGCHAAKM